MKVFIRTLSMDGELHRWCNRSMDYRLIHGFKNFIHGWVHPRFGCIINASYALQNIKFVSELAVSLATTLSGLTNELRFL